MLNTLTVLAYLLSQHYHHHATLQVSLQFQKNLATQTTEISPKLQWQNIPPGAQSIAFVIKDARTQIKPHYYWVVYNLPVESHGFEWGENRHLDVSHVGWNSWGQRNMYAMPNHSIIFSVYALDKKFSIDHMTGELLKKKMQRHVLAMGETEK